MGVAVMQVDGPERVQLAQALSVEPDAVNGALKTLEAAAIEEYVGMILARSIPQRLEDLRRYRLLLITRNFWNRIPTEEEVGRLFHTTRPQSRSLLRTTIATYRQELDAIVKKTLADLVKSASHLSSGNVWEISADPQMVTALNEYLDELDPSLPPISRRPATVGQYLIQPSAREALLEHLSRPRKANKK